MLATIQTKREIPIYDPNLVLYLPLWKRDGTTFISDDAGGYTATVTGSPWIFQGRTFNGSNQQISLGTPSALNITVAITVEAWLQSPFTNTTGFGGNYMLSKGLTNNRGYGFSFATGGTTITWEFYDGGSQKARTYLATANTWYHVVGTYDGTSSKLYINGTQPGATLSYTGDIDATPTDNFLLGNDGGRYANCTVGEVRIYNRALTPQEVCGNFVKTKWRYQ